MIKVILDANFLIYCAEQKIDYKEEIARLMTEGYELVVPEGVIKELESLSKNSKKYSDKVAAGLASKLLAVNNVKITKSKARNVDNDIINESEGNIVATLDLGLRDKVNNVIVIKGKKKLGFG